MIKALWLTSWYPNELDNWNGDFIQRQARAASLYCDITVIHAEADTRDMLKEPVVFKTNRSGDLTEHIILYKRSSYKIAGRFINLVRYKKYFKAEIKKYIRKNGLPDIVHVHVAMKAGLLALWIKKKYKIPYIVTEHWTIYQPNAEHAYSSRNFVFKKWTAEILKKAALLLPVSDNLGEIISKTVEPVNYKRVFNVVDTRYFNYKNFEETHPFTFIHVSSLTEQKNPRAIIESFLSFHALHLHSKLVVAGEVPENLSSYISEKKVSADSIEFTGLIPYEEIARVMQKSDAFILFSRYENMPCVVLEALCCGLPVIASGVGGLREVINPDNGIIVQDYSTAALVSAMENIFISYKKFNRSNISAAAVSKFSYEVIGEGIKNIYRDVLNDRSKK